MKSLKRLSHRPLSPSKTQEGAPVLAVPVLRTEASSEPAYKVTIKRNDTVYQSFLLLNTILSVLGVILIISLFGVVFWGLITITEVRQVLEIMQKQ